MACDVERVYMTLRMMRRVVYLCALLSYIVACTEEPPTTPTIIQPKVQRQYYLNADFGFSIDFPTGWTVKDAVSGDSDLLKKARLDQGNGRVTNIFVYARLLTSAERDAFLSNNVALDKSVREKSNGTFRLGDASVHWTETEAPETPAGSACGITYRVIRGNLLIEVVCLAMGSSVASYLELKPEFIATVESLSFVEETNVVDKSKLQRQKQNNKIHTYEIKLSAPVGPIAFNARVPIQFRRAQSSSDVAAHLALARQIEGNPIGKSVVYEAFSVDWSHASHLPILYVGTIPAAKDGQGRFTSAYWKQFKEQFDKHSALLVVTLRQQMVSYGMPDISDEMERIVKTTDSNTSIVFGFLPTGANSVPPHLVARKLIFIRNSIVLFEIAVDASKPNAMAKLSEIIESLDLE